MKIVKWLSPSMSAMSGDALIKVEPNEDADIEKMLVLVDGDSVGHFGVSASLVKTGEEMPKIKPKMYNGKRIGSEYFTSERQFGYANASAIKKEVRYYEVFVNRD